MMQDNNNDDNGPGTGKSSNDPALFNHPDWPSGQRDNVIRLPDPASRRKTGDKNQPPKAPPMFNLPPCTKILVGVIIAVHVCVSLLMMVNPIFEAMIAGYGGFTPAAWTGDVFYPSVLVTPFTYAFLHGGWLHLGINAVTLIAFGSAVERLVGGRVMMAVYAFSVLAAAAAHFAIDPSGTAPMVGASGGISGLFGASIIAMNRAAKAQGAPTQRLLPLIGLWIGISALLGFLGGPGGAQIAWASHIGGFAAGLGIGAFLLRRR